MTNDLISQAEALLGRFAALKEHAKIKPNAVMLELIDIREALIEMVPGLVDEIKRLRVLECAAKANMARRDSDISDLTKELAKWQQIAIKQRALINFIETEERYAYSEHVILSDDEMSIAAKELGLQAAQDDTGEELTIAYMLGSRKANDRLKVLQDYVGRLESKYIDSNAARRYYADGYEAPWPQVGNEFKERYIKDAQAALEKIRRG